MTGWNLPPGCNVSDLPGCGPDDEAWEVYWHETDRPDEVYHDTYPDGTVASSKLLIFYDTDPAYHDAIEHDFEKWLDDLHSKFPEYEKEE